MHNIVLAEDPISAPSVPIRKPVTPAPRKSDSLVAQILVGFNIENLELYIQLNAERSEK